MKVSARFASWLTLVMLLVPALVAQDAQIEKGDAYQATLVVTAEKREEKLEDVPLSVSVLSEKTLESAGVDNITEASYLIPNLSISSFAAKRTSSAYIRGIGAGQGDPGVTTYIDGVPQLVPASVNIELLDLERIEVLRGPQGTLYGRNTIGGLIHYITKDPSDELSYRLLADIGDTGHLRGRGSLSGAIAPGKAYYRVGGAVYQRDGFTENQTLGEDVDFQDTTFLRLQLMLTPSESWRIRLTGYAQEDDDGGFLLNDRTLFQAEPYTLNHDYRGYTRRDLDATSATVEYFGQNFTFTAITSFDNNDIAERTDLDFLPVDLLQRETLEDHEQFYQELRLSSPGMVGDRVGITWSIGATWFSADFVHDAYTEVRPFASGIPDTSLFLNEYYELDDSGLGIFGEATLTFAERFDVTLGLRYESEERNWLINPTTLAGQFPVSITTGEDSDDFDQLLPRLGLAYRLEGGTMIFANAAKSYRAGGFNRNTASLGQYVRDFYTYGEEESWSYEAGFKTSFLENRLYLAATVFSIDWDDRQLSIPIPEGQGQFYLDNAAKATSRGVELELIGALTDNLDLSLGFGTNNAEFGHYIDPTTGVDVDGKALPTTPDQNWNLGLNAHKQFGAYKAHARVDVVGIGQLYYDNINSDGQNDYNLVNLRLGVERAGLSLVAWGKNVGDEEYFPIGIPATIPNPQLSGWAVRPGDPVTYGITIGFRH